MNGTPDPSPAEAYNYADFTDEAYGSVVRAAARRYSFEPFGTGASAPHVLWRHDVDFSVHRALALAKIEADEGARATYLIALRSAMYNVLEPAVLSRLREIAKLGHWIGLHFDLGAHRQLGGTADELDDAIRAEAEMLARLAGAPVRTLSFHNPGASGADALEDQTLGGLVNAYGRGVKSDYTYVSDSNGYWRHARLPDVVAEGTAERLHVLTHPEWWQPEAMSPRERLERCLAGRTDHAREWYAGPVREWGRELPG